MVTLEQDCKAAKKSVTFAKLPKKEASENKAFLGSKTVWPISTRNRFFLPYFPLKCPHHGNLVRVCKQSFIGKGKFGTVFGGQIADHEPCSKCKKRQQMMQAPQDGQLAVKELKKWAVLQNLAEVQIIEEMRIHSVCSGLPNVLPFVIAWQDSFHLYVAFPICHQGTLADLFMRRKAPFSSLSIFVAATQLFKGLNAIHDLGVIYRDVKLKNVLLSKSGNLLITDFGLAKWLNRRQRTHTICGTLAFMAPEVAQARPYDHSVDLWSLGVLLFCMAFASLPFPRVTDHEELAQVFRSKGQHDLWDLIKGHESEQVTLLLDNLLRLEPSERNFCPIKGFHEPLPTFTETL